MALGWLLGRWLSRPLREVEVATTRVAAGDLGYRVPVRGQDELGQVAASFNAMSADLAEAIATEARLRHAAEALAARETLLNRINARIRASLDTETVLRATLEELVTALRAARAFLHLERAGRTLSFAYEWTRPGVVPASVYRPRRMVVVDLAAKERSTIAVNDLETDPRFFDPSLPPRPRTPGIGTRAILAAPLYQGDTLLGVLVIHDLETRVWTPDEIALVEAVAGAGAVAVGPAGR